MTDTSINWVQVTEFVVWTILMLKFLKSYLRGDVREMIMSSTISIIVTIMWIATVLRG